jgi:hypothetical protein
MARWLNKAWLSPLLGVLIVLIGGSGTLMFFHLGPRSLRPVHEWLGLALVVAVVLHLALHFSELVQQLRRPLGIGAAALALLVGAVLWAAAPGGRGEGSGPPGERREMHRERGHRASSGAVAEQAVAAVPYASASD